jgi:signal transduction histidine kinase
LSDSWESTERVVLLVRELRKLVRPDPPKSELVAVNDVVRAAARVAGPHFYGRATLRLELQTVARVLLDRRQLGQVVIAILIHAAQSIPPTSSGASGSEKTNLCSVRTAMVGSEVVLVVEDTGASLSADQLPRVFDPFFTKRFGDAGSLGLAVSRDVVEAAGGRIGIESDGRGNRITVRFPAADDSHVAH